MLRYRPDGQNIMKKENPKFPGIYLAENIVDYHGQVGIIRLSFPRCFIWFEQDVDSIYCSYEEFVEGIAHINWLDPNDNGNEEEKQHALVEMWNFLCEEEREEERLYGELD